LCGCECEPTKHHLIPVSKAKNKYRQIRNDESNFIWICRQCHDQIHSLYDNNWLRDNLNTLELILADEKIAQFVRWRQKHSEFKGHSKMSNQRKMRSK